MGRLRVVVAAVVVLTVATASAQTRAPRRISDLDDVPPANSAARPTSPPACDTPSDSIVHVRSARLVGINKLPVAAQSAIESMLTEHYYDECVMEAEITEHVRRSVQEHGYFLAEVHKPEITDLDDPRDGPREVSVVVRVDEGDLYRLGSITFVGYQALPVEQIRAAFLMNPGDILDVVKVGEALESLRTLYSRRGYLNFTPVPDANIDRQRHTVGLRITLDEGPQFRVGNVNIVGLDNKTQQSLLESWTMPSGKPYNSRLLENFFFEQRYTLPAGSTAAKNADLQVDSREHTVDITLDFRDQQ